MYAEYGASSELWTEHLHHGAQVKLRAENAEAIGGDLFACCINVCIDIRSPSHCAYSLSPVSEMRSSMYSTKYDVSKTRQTSGKSSFESLKKMGGRFNSFDHSSKIRAWIIQWPSWERPRWQSIRRTAQVSMISMSQSKTGFLHSRDWARVSKLKKQRHGSALVDYARS